MNIVTTKTKQPTGLTITRNGAKFTFQWKINDEDYRQGQLLQYRINSGKWVTVPVSASATTKLITLDTSKYYPVGKTKITSVTFHVRGRRANYRVTKRNSSGEEITTEYRPGWSEFSEKSFSVQVPEKPSLTASLSSTDSNVTTFSWELATSPDSRRPFSDMQWQSVLIKECSTSDGTKVSFSTRNAGWATGTPSGSTGSITRTEDTSLLANNSYTRWVRIRARGFGGVSDWRYARHVYAKPPMAVVKSAKATENSSGGLACKVTWVAQANTAHPIDNTTVQYCIETPLADLVCPSGASWTDADISKDTSGTDAANFSIDDKPGTDQCLYVRVNTQHDENVTYGEPKLVMKGKLADPTISSVTTSAETFRATITATNASTVPDSFLVVLFKTASKPTSSSPIGIIPHGETSVTVQCPDWTGKGEVSFGVYAATGSYTAKAQAGGVTRYTVERTMRSASTVWGGGNVPQAPTGVSAQTTDTPGTIRVTWDWTWSEADIAELSWADHADAWESTDGPSTYQVTNLNASAWNISGLQTGVTWYVRVRLIRSTGDSYTYGDYSETVAVDLSSAPAVPVLALSKAVMAEDETVTASWAFSTADGSMQAYAEVCEAQVSGGVVTYGDVIAHAETAQHVSISAADAGWTAGNTYYLCVRVVSASGRASDGWSDPVSVIVAEDPACEITQTSLETVTVTDDEGEERSVLALTVMPLTLTVTGADQGGETAVSIVRAESYQLERPDESSAIGYEGETAASYSQTGESQITIGQEDLVGMLDDGAKYRIIATVTNELGRAAEASLDFEVRWTHQALIPEAEIEIDEGAYAAFITPVAPEGVAEGDVCDIYRLSVDKPELIVSGAEWGTKYVDPFPALGEHGGHRIVFRTVNGDSITEDNRLAWTDYGDADGDVLDYPYTLIDFGGDRVQLELNLTVSNSWEKDFRETKYLGGAVQGDWNSAVSRTGSVSAVVLMVIGQETVRAMRRLAVFPGICHVRTPEGSSFAADVQVSENVTHESAAKIAEFTISMTRVDPEEPEGMLYDEWYVPEE